jgi:multiple sugar transport system permease protein
MKPGFGESIDLIYQQQTRKELNLKFHRRYLGLLFISPWLVGFIAFIGGPMLYSLYLSFTDYKLGRDAQFIGLDNYVRMFSDDFWLTSLTVTLKFSAIVVPVWIVFSFLLALLLSKNLKGSNFFRSAYYIPAMVASIAYGFIWKLMMSPGGLLSYFLSLFGIDPPPSGFLTDPDWAFPGLVLISLWSVGPMMVIFYTGIKNINRELYEASSIDGANSLNNVLHITIPLSTPSILFNLITGIVAAFQYFQMALVLTQGGPLNATYFYALNTYINGFRYGKMGYAAANSWFMVLVLLLVTVVIYGSSKYWVHQENR